MPAARDAGKSPMKELSLQDGAVNPASSGVGDVPSLHGKRRKGRGVDFFFFCQAFRSSYNPLWPEQNKTQHVTN